MIYRRGDSVEDLTREQKLFYFLVMYQKEHQEVVQKMFEYDLDYYTLLGYLCFNRLAGLAYYNIRKCGYKVQNEQFLFALENMYNAQVFRNSQMYLEINKINCALKNAKFPFAFLKGSILSNTIYTKGLRISNDVDILINASNISDLVRALEPLGYVQGEYDIKSQKVNKPTRRDIVFRRMNWGEAYPLVKTFQSDFMKYLEIDINFSLDWIPDNPNGAVSHMLNNTTEYGDGGLQSLSLEDFFIHLLMHLYKELILFTCVECMRDMEYYKFVDILWFLRMYKEKIDLAYFLLRVNKFGLNDEIYTAIYYVYKSISWFDKESIMETLLNELESRNAKLIDTIQDTETNEQYYYPGTILQRLFDPFRKEHLVKK